MCVGIGVSSDIVPQVCIACVMCMPVTMYISEAVHVGAHFMDNAPGVATFSRQNVAKVIMIIMTTQLTMAVVAQMHSWRKMSLVLGKFKTHSRASSLLAYDSS